jgi:hypothetical protein
MSTGRRATIVVDYNLGEIRVYLQGFGIGCHIHAKCLRAKNAVRLGDDATPSNTLVRDPATIDRQRHTGDGCGAIGA